MPPIDTMAAIPQRLSNEAVATRLAAAADLLEQQGANPFRVRAYQRAAATVRGLASPLGEVVAAGGSAALDELPNVGKGIASSIDEMVRTGRWSFLERLQGKSEPERLLMSVPGIGEKLARRLHENLHVDSLEALEMTAHDGRLEQVPGVGRRRAAAIQAYLAFRLEGAPRFRRKTSDGPGVAVLLEVDAEYRLAARAGRLETIAPRRLNPQRRSWLPVGHFERAGWHFTALFSNTARAHQLGRVKDWVILYFYDDQHWEGQYTVVTETRGPLGGLRVVRGREEECNDYYERSDAAWRRMPAPDLERARRDPAAVFCSPAELAAHPELGVEAKLELLGSWRYDASALEVAVEEGMPGEVGALGEVLAAIDELAGGFAVARTPPTKLGIAG